MKIIYRIIDTATLQSMVLNVIKNRVVKSAIKNIVEDIRVDIEVVVEQEVKADQFPSHQNNINVIKSVVVEMINIVVRVEVDQRRHLNIKRRNIIINHVQKKLIIITIPSIKMLWFKQ